MTIDTVSHSKGQAATGWHEGSVVVPRRVLGGIKRSSQTPRTGVFDDDEQGSAAAGDPGGARQDLVAGAAVHGTARGPGAVLGRDCPRPVDRGGGDGRGGGIRSGSTVVPGGCGNATDLVGPPVGPLAVLRRAGEHCRLAPQEVGSSRSPAGCVVTLDDLGGAAPQRLDAYRRPVLSGVHRAVARRTPGPVPQGRQDGRQ
jgi:hypothetical protein